MYAKMLLFRGISLDRFAWFTWYCLYSRLDVYAP